MKCQKHIRTKLTIVSLQSTLEKPSSRESAPSPARENIPFSEQFMYWNTSEQVFIPFIRFLAIKQLQWPIKNVTRESIDCKNFKKISKCLGIQSDRSKDKLWSFQFNCSHSSDWDEQTEWFNKERQKMKLHGRAHTGCVFVYLSLCLKLQGTSFVDNKIMLYTYLHDRNTTIDLILLTSIMTASLLTQSWITKKNTM